MSSKTAKIYIQKETQKHATLELAKKFITAFKLIFSTFSLLTLCIEQ